MTKPNLLYFPLMGRAIPIELLLVHAKVEYTRTAPGEDGNKAWGELKAEFPERGGLPWYTNEQGKVMSQHKAVLKALAQQHGYVSNDPAITFETEWVFETHQDLFEKIRGKAFGAPDPTSDDGKECVEGMGKFFEALEKRAADGRKYVSGNSPTAADFIVLPIMIASIDNPNAKNPELAKAFRAELDKRPKIAAILANLKKENGIEAYAQTWYDKKAFI